MIELLHQTFIIAGAAGVFITVPGVLELLLVTGRVFRPTTLSSEPTDHGFRLAAVVPAHNEEALVGACVASILCSAQAGPFCEVVVVADNCTDATATRAMEAGARVLVREDFQ